MNFFKLSRILIHANLKILPNNRKIKYKYSNFNKMKETKIPHYQNSSKIPPDCENKECH